MKYKIVSIKGHLVCDDLDTLEEARKCYKELNEVDRNDGTYTKGYYKIRKEK